MSQIKNVKDRALVVGVELDPWQARMSDPLLPQNPADRANTPHRKPDRVRLPVALGRECGIGRTRVLLTTGEPRQGREWQDRHSARQVCGRRWPAPIFAKCQPHYAFTINMELGLLVTGGKVPGQVQEHFDRLAFDGTLARN